MSVSPKQKIEQLADRIMSGQSDVATLQELLVAIDSELLTVKEEQPEEYLKILTALNEFLSEVEALYEN